MILSTFMEQLGLQKPLLAIQGDIFDTPADHIAFAVHWPNTNGHYNNDDGGFSSLVAKYGWNDLGTIRFEKGVPVSKKIRGKYFHALPVHTPEVGGWDEAPKLIEDCLNRLEVPSTEVITTVLIGGGNAGQKYKASVSNIEGMIRSYKTVVLCVFQDWMFDLLVSAGVVAEATPKGLSLAKLPKVVKYGDYFEERLRKKLVEN